MKIELPVCRSLLFIFAFPLISPMVYADSAPDSDPRQYYFTLPQPDLNSQHPPYLYDYEPDNKVSQATFGLNFHRPHNGQQIIPLYGTAFFIDTDRSDNKICALTAGHGVTELQPPYQAEIHNLKIPLESSIATNYRRHDSSDVQKVSLYGKHLAARAIEVVYAKDGSLIQGITPDQPEYVEDIALLLIDKAQLKNVNSISTLAAGYLPRGAYPMSLHPSGAMAMVLKGHPFGWPLHKNTVSSIIERNNSLAAYGFVAVTDAPVSGGMSGSPLVYGTTAYGINSRNINEIEKAGLVSTLTPLEKHIEETCFQNKNPRAVYKVSTLSRMKAFVNGFTASGKNRDVVAHLSGASSRQGNAETAYVSTTKSQRVALKLAQNYIEENPGKEVYLYKIRADNRFSNASASLWDTLKHHGSASAPTLTFSRVAFDDEYLFVNDMNDAGIPAENIENALLLKKEKGDIRFLMFENDKYKAANTRASEFSYVGPLPENPSYRTWVTRTNSSQITGAGMMPEVVVNKPFPAEALLHSEL